MSLNVKLQLYRGLLSSLSTLASTGSAGVLVWTTDSQELYVDSGSGTGIGPGNAWQKVAAGNAYFTAASIAAMTALPAQIGDLVDRTDLHQNWILTAFPPTTAANWKALDSDSSTTGIIGLVGPMAHEFVTFIDTTGVQHLAQPAFTDISGLLSQIQLPITIGAGTSLTNIDLGIF